MSQSLSGSLEELVLAGLIWDNELASAIVMRTTPDLFTTRHYRTIAKAATDHVIRYAEAPRNHLPDILEDDINKAEAGAQLWKTINRLQEVHSDMQPQYVLDEISKFIASRKMAQAIAKASDHLHKGDLDKAHESLHQIDEVVDIDSGIWMHEPAKALSFLDHDLDSEQEFGLGIKALDERGIRPKRKTLLVFMAPKKRGKSMALIHAGREAAFVNHQKVLHITLEMSDEEVAQRYVQSICGWTAGDWNDRTIRVPMFKRDEGGNYIGIDFDLLTPQILNRNSRKDAADKIRSVSRGRKLLIKEFPTNNLSSAQLIMFLEHLKRVEKFEPDLLIVDYANLMSMNAAQLRFETGRVFKDLRGIAVSRNMAVVTATQGNRLSENARIVGSVHVAEDWSILGTADIVLTICRTPEEHEKRLARIYVAAARRVPDQYLVMITQNYECCQFARDSIYMNRIADRDFERMLQEDDD